MCLVHRSGRVSPRRLCSCSLCPLAGPMPGGSTTERRRLVAGSLTSWSRRHGCGMTSSTPAPTSGSPAPGVAGPRGFKLNPALLIYVMSALPARPARRRGHRRERWASKRLKVEMIERLVARVRRWDNGRRARPAVRHCKEHGASTDPASRRAGTTTATAQH
jgi:hypothetical protein